MTTKTIEKSAKLERTVAPRASEKSAKSPRAQAATTTKARNHEAAPDQRSSQAPTTKQAQLVILLSRPEGAIIEELIGTPGSDVNQLALPLDVKHEGERARQ